MGDIRVRFAPSPTGFLHIGGLRTALYNYLYAKRNNGKFVLRIEDTDQTRLVEGAIENLIHALSWAGVTYDEGVFIENGEVVQKGEFGPYIQSERLDIYKKYVEELVEKGDAYYCFCDHERLENLREEQKAMGKVPKYDGLCRGISLEDAKTRVAAGEEHVIRLKMPKNKDIVFKDGVRGTISINSDDLDDQVLLKSDGFPTYHLAVVIDDHLMGITHVVRGEEWVPSTPKHVYLFECFGWPAPEYVHLPAVLNKSGKKLSKREGDVSVEDFKRSGYLSDGLVNYLALVGWSPDDNQEIMTLDEMVEKFSFDRVSKSGGIFDREKLNWVNSYYIKELTDQELFDLAVPFIVDAQVLDKSFIDSHKNWVMILLNTVKDSLDTLKEVPEKIKFILDPMPENLNDEEKEILKGETVPQLVDAIIEKLEGMESLSFDDAKTFMKEIQKETGIKGKNLFMPTRIAITGVEHGPELQNILYLLGKEELLKRLEGSKKYL